jgi:hypothetical protein
MAASRADVITKVNPKKLAAQGEKIYDEKLKGILEPEHNGKIVAIEVESGDYFLGNSIVEATEKAKQKYPDRLFHVIKVGYPAVHKRRSP